MSPKIIILFLFWGSMSAFCQNSIEHVLNRLEYLQDVYYGSMRKSMEYDYTNYEKITKELIALNPQNPYNYYHHAKALFLNGNIEPGIEATQTLLNFSTSLWSIIKNDSLFVENIPPQQWNELQHIEEHNTPISKAKKAFEIEQKGFAAEGMAINKLTKSLFIGSIRKGKIIEISNEGKVSDFSLENQYNILEVLGLELTPNGKELWACAQYYDATITNEQFGVFQFNVASKELMQVHVPTDTLQHQFNDLTIVPNQGVFVTDSREGGVYKIANGKMELFIDTKDIALTNGITHSGSDLYIADVFWGVMNYNLTNNIKTWIETPESISLTHIDGLTYYDGGLIAHQFSLQGVFYYKLEENKVIEKKTLTYNHPLLKDHTTGDILGNYYYFIANSDIDAMNRYGDEITDEHLTTPIILKQKLWE